MIWLLACTGGPGADSGTKATDSADTADTATSTGPVDQEFVAILGAPADGLGNAVAVAGDPDGDGDEDLLAAAYLGNRVCVVPAPVPDGVHALDELGVSCFVGETDYDYAGYGTTAAGDVDGDGVDDLLVGSIGNGDNGANAGKVYLIRGPVAPGSTSLAAAWAVWRGESAGDFAGVNLAAAGDLTGDGLSDYLVGASGYDAGGTAGGRAYLLAGPLAAGDYALSEAWATFTGAAGDVTTTPPPHGAFGVGDFVGDGLVGPGDLDGDGVPDLAIAAAGDATLGLSTGRVDVYQGPIVAGPRLPEDADLAIRGVAAGSYTGSPLLGPGDLSGDGLADLLVTADGVGTGSVFLIADVSLSGERPVTDAAVRWDGAAAGDLFGFSLATGDSNGDGAIDLLVGAPASSPGGTYSGGAWWFAGPFRAGTYAAGDGRALHGVPGVGSFGSAVAIGPDLDGDGDVDLVVGEYTGSAGGGFAGTVYGIGG